MGCNGDVVVVLFEAKKECDDEKKSRATTEREKEQETMERKSDGEEGEGDEHMTS